MKRRESAGSTLIELLVVVWIIALLMALILPAVQSAREAARRLTCRSHLRQIGLAVLHHEEAHGYFPSGGWGYAWVGEPQRGTRADQPGGWIYNILPYVEAQNLRNLGKHASPADRRIQITMLLESPLEIFHCPSRRGAALFPYDVSLTLRNADTPAAAAKSDYAINGGDVLVRSGRGPNSLAEGDSPSYAWPDFSRATGICHLRSAIRGPQITDGRGLTYLAGEKCVGVAALPDAGDDQTMYLGYDADTTRWAQLDWPPMPDGARVAHFRFGSAHPTSCGFVFCDGSVRDVSFTIDGEVHRQLGNRRDGAVVHFE